MQCVIPTMIDERRERKKGNNTFWDVSQFLSFSICPFSRKFSQRFHHRHIITCWYGELYHSNIVKQRFRETRIGLFDMTPLCVICFDYNIIIINVLSILSTHLLNKEIKRKFDDESLFYSWIIYTLYNQISFTSICLWIYMRVLRRRKKNLCFFIVFILYALFFKGFWKNFSVLFCFLLFFCAK